VLRVRTIEEEVARGRLLAATGAEAAAARATEAARSSYDTVPRPAQGPSTVFRRDYLRQTAAAAGVRSAHARLELVAADADAVRDRWRAAAMRSAALERLADRASNEHRRGLLAEEQRTAEEIAAAVRTERVRR
jgi:hypothetical protein